MIADAQTLVTAFAGQRCIAAGPLAEVLSTIKEAHDLGANPLVFDDASALPVELDLRGSLGEALGRLTPAPAKGPGRPKLGVVAREVTLLPRHWEWLADQPGGASVALRKLVETASRDGKAEVRAAQTTLNRFMSAMAGNLPGFEEAGRALFAGDKAGFERETRGWPQDVRDYARRLAAPAFA